MSLSPRHKWRKDVFKTREELSLLMLFWSSFKLMDDFFTLYPPKSYIWPLKMLQAKVLRKCHTVPCIPNILRNIRNQLMAGEEHLQFVVCKTQVAKGARSALRQPHCLGGSVQPMHCPPSPAQLRGSPLITASKSLYLLHLFFAAPFSERLRLKILNEF